MCQVCQKVPLSTFFYPSTFSQKLLFWRRFGLKDHPNHIKPILTKTNKFFLSKIHLTYGKF